MACDPSEIIVQLQNRPTSTNSPSVPVRVRRLVGQLVTAFHQSCDMKEFSIAKRILALVEVLHSRSPEYGSREHHREARAIVAAHERLWELQYPEQKLRDAGGE